MAYPSNIDVFTTKVDGVDDILAAHINGVQSSIVATQTELGVGLKGSAVDLLTRLATSLNTDGSLKASQVLAAITAGTITLSMLAANSVDSSKIVDGSITGSDIAGTTITGANIAATTIATGNIQNLAITTAKIANGAVTATQFSGILPAANLPVDVAYLDVVQSFTAVQTFPGSTASPTRVTGVDASGNTVILPAALRHENSGGAGAASMGVGLGFEAESTTGGSFNLLGDISIEALTAALGTQDGQIRLRAAVAGTQTNLMRLSSQRVRIEQAPAASANNALFNIGDQGFEGGGGTAFVGSASGTALGTNMAAGFAGNHVDFQLAGVSKFLVNAAGGLSANNASFTGVVGGNTGSAFQWASATATPGADADYTLLTTEMAKVIITVVAGSWTSGHNVIVPNGAGSVWHFSNSTGFSMTVKTAAGTGIAIANGRAAWIRSNGTNCRRMTADIDPTV